ncbi:xanthine dehydrogenase family protein molybdopterin-binding subunit [Microbaculum marinum]|uniref:Xanthine dehydrogenase family protein molybdopterin-binding subunit n=1 Tax=Microbaculum marinum TaxID=1764581 RepID=A0AAW9RL10_9HYPH
MGAKYFGARVERREDEPLLRGKGQFTDDIVLSDALVAVIVRSPWAHARIDSVDVSEAAGMPGVHSIWTMADLPDCLRGRQTPIQVPNAAIRQPHNFPVLADGEATFVGEPVAVVLADSRELGEDAAQMVFVDGVPLPVAADVGTAAEPGAPLMHSSLKDNIAADLVLQFGEDENPFEAAEVVIEETFRQHRGCCQAMECRAVQAQYDALTDQLTVWSAAQAPHMVKNIIVEMLGHDDGKVRVIAPDVGGGFGPKGMVYPEEVLCAALARETGRPVKWTEDRREHFLSTTQERDQIWTMRVAADRDGRLIAVEGDLVHDSGCAAPWGIILPYIAATTVPGPYVIPNYRMRMRSVFTNKPPTTPLRGAGRPQAVFAMERMMDRLADRLGLDPAEVRRRNMIRPDQMPYRMGLIYRDGSPLTYDSGDYPECQRLALAKADWEGFKQRQSAALAEGRYIGIGVANYVEGTGLGPYEGSKARVAADGRIEIASGAAPQGQGQKTILAQIAADAFGVPMEDVDVRVADTGIVPIGIGTFASRVTVNAGSSTHNASKSLRAKVIKFAALRLEVPEADIEIDSRVVRARGTNRSVTLGELRQFANGMPGFTLPEGLEPGLETADWFSPRQATYCNGTHVAEVEVDADTGAVEIRRYVVAHDSGRLVNPMAVDGQIQGGVAHGIGNALFEHMHYDDEAQPVTTTLADYLLPMAPDVPDVEIVHMETPTPLNPLGVKGAGEGGTIPAAACIVAAVEDALRPFGARFSECPLSPQRIVEVICQSKKVA